MNNNMDTSEIKKLIISSLDTDADTSEVLINWKKRALSYNFSNSFRDKVLE